MAQTQSQEDLIKRYLLGELSASEQAALEDEYFLDHAKYDQLCQVENELLDRYARGSLSPVDRQRFERNYLTNPGRMRHILFAKAFAKIVDEETAAQQTAKWKLSIRPETGRSQLTRLILLFQQPRFALSIALVTIAMLIGVGGAWLMNERALLLNRLTEARREAEKQQQRAQAQDQQITALETKYRQIDQERERLKSQLDAILEKDATSPRTPALFTLPISAFRNFGSGDSRPFIISAGAEEIRLRLYLEEHAFRLYQVMLLTTNDKEVFTVKGLSRRSTRTGDYVIVNIPVDKLTAGENVISLSGINETGELETLGKALFRVRKQ
jgi:hypothetical protein